jgi:hypothetical protein
MIVTDMTEAEAEQPVLELAEPPVPEEPAAEPKPAPKRVPKRRAPRKPAAKKPAAASPSEAKRAEPGQRRRRRSALAIPALLDPIMIPEDAQGRVEFIVRPLPVRPQPPKVKKARTTRKGKAKPAEPAAVPAGAVPWTMVALIGEIMVVIFFAGVLILR